jgi:hypothetical protein
MQVVATKFPMQRNREFSDAYQGKSCAEQEYWSGMSGRPLRRCAKIAASVLRCFQGRRSLQNRSAINFRGTGRTFQYRHVVLPCALQQAERIACDAIQATALFLSFEEIEFLCGGK